MSKLTEEETLIASKLAHELGEARFKVVAIVEALGVEEARQLADRAHAEFGTALCEDGSLRTLGGVFFRHASVLLKRHKIEAAKALTAERAAIAAELVSELGEVDQRARDLIKLRLRKSGVDATRKLVDEARALFAEGQQKNKDGSPQSAGEVFCALAVPRARRPGSKQAHIAMLEEKAAQRKLEVANLKEKVERLTAELAKVTAERDKLARALTSPQPQRPQNSVGGPRRQVVDVMHRRGGR